MEHSSPFDPRSLTDSTPVELSSTQSDNSLYQNDSPQHEEKPQSPIRLKKGIVFLMALVMLVLLSSTLAFAARKNSWWQKLTQPKVTPIPTIQPIGFISSPSPTVTPTPSPSFSPTPKPTPRPSVKASPTPFSSPISLLTNVRFKRVLCQYPDASQQNLLITLSQNQQFEEGSPSIIDCDLTIENTTTVPTEDTFYSITQDGALLKKESIGILAQGIYLPNNSFIQNVTPKQDVGTHTVTITVNPDKLYPESNWDDNSYTFTYQIVADRTPPVVTILDQAQWIQDSQVCYNFGFVNTVDNHSIYDQLHNEYQLDDNAWTSDRTTLVCVPKVSGASHTVRGKSTDQRGNIGQAERTFIIP
ncbi:hypothetical protein C5B42_04755 [Candidatus Cerribacteria bacterium 'Amazon FNV 2010 28 9']|uniref:CARDB domain-containing protein n=1 Tax=Candidatus Cerribacteria bacterium 'Amazon FNV 2010 28 9' TaxID=2081795 RepID=A0A317JP71_9BACT|nr:MAG: hypothetical protein C5B42_04755 [Candidatus Cerribacteria bacterium 'Amazon FNV 2010 28 9']